MTRLMGSSDQSSFINHSTFWVLLAALLVVPQVGSAHIDGFGTIPGFTAPYGIVSPEGDRIEYQWNDDEQEPTALFRFYYKVGNGLPVDVPPQYQREGTEIGEMPAASEVDNLSWDTSALPTGAYTLFSETDDPPLCEVTEFLPALIIIQRNDDPMPLGGLFSEPPPAGSVADRAAEVELQVTSPTQPKLTLRAGHVEVDLEADTPFSLCYEERQKLVYDFDLLSDELLDPHPTLPEHWVLNWLWDTQSVTEGLYILEATVSTGGETEPVIVYSNGAVNVLHLGPASTDELPEEVVEPEGGCQSSPSIPWWLLLFTAWLWRRKGQRVPYTQA